MLPASSPRSLSLRENAYTYADAPPLASELQASMEQYGLEDAMYRDPYYSNEFDVPENPREFAGLVYHLRGGEGPSFLKEWDDGCDKVKGKAPTDFREIAEIFGWEYASSPPSVREVKKWLQSDAGKLKAAVRDSKSQSQASNFCIVNGSETPLSCMLDRRCHTEECLWPTEHTICIQCQPNKAGYDGTFVGSFR